jgi:hypothetical protein
MRHVSEVATHRSLSPKCWYDVVRDIALATDTAAWPSYFFQRAGGADSRASIILSRDNSLWILPAQPFLTDHAQSAQFGSSVQRPTTSRAAAWRSQAERMEPPTRRARPHPYGAARGNSSAKNLLMSESGHSAGLFLLAGLKSWDLNQHRGLHIPCCSRNRRHRGAVEQRLAHQGRK